eukprot:CAMPEP_0119127042 /NCGR_PEP_ID=MMETSP1310-20130426/5738_1 /TAXON_ID=464262 /ORGANISM="Genus nov. species nov., Strain RCC2339" /LENGTH=64 /DNA_ID=CAMNT_0007117261 /DNA_START=95 /DNA_END=285 /DNA_ORIENTATION=-
MNVPYVAMYFAAYESLKTSIAGHSKDDRSRSFVHVLSGAGAGAVAAAVTNPLDVTRTRLQTQDA